MYKEKIDSLIKKWKKLYMKDTKKYNSLLVIIIFVILSINVFNYVVDKIERNERNEIRKIHRGRDNIRMSYLDNFMKESIKPKEKLMWFLKTYKTSDYFFNVKDIDDLKVYFDKVSKNYNWPIYSDFLKTDREHNACWEHEDIFKVEKTKTNRWGNDVKIYIGLCIENAINQVDHSRNDWWFFNNYYEFMIWEWTKEEVLEWIEITEADFTDEAYDNLGVLYLNDYEEYPDYWDSEKKKYISNFKRKVFKKTFIHNKEWSNYLFYVNSAEDLKKYFYRNSWIVNYTIFSDFIEENIVSRCWDNETIFKQKQVNDWNNIYIGLCLEDETDWDFDEWFFDWYEEFMVWNWTKEEIMEWLNMDESYSK